MNKYQAATLINLEIRSMLSSLRQIAVIGAKLPLNSHYKQRLNQVKFSDLYEKMQRLELELKQLSFEE